MNQAKEPGRQTGGQRSGPAEGGRRGLAPPVRRWSERLVLAVTAALVFRTWYVQGLFVGMPVASGSMADGLLGPHRWVLCDRCGFGFAVGRDGGPVRSRPVCPNCGARCRRRSTGSVGPGDRVLVDKFVFGLRRPRRWEVVVLRHPEHPARLVIKRVVGLPGERVELRGGELWIDGRIQRKSLRQQRALAVTVHDARHSPAGDTSAPRWRGDGPRTGWKISRGVFSHPVTGRADGVDWLVYHHPRPRVPGAAAGQEGPITDQRGYNQWSTRHPASVHPVVDVGAECRLLRVEGRGELFFRASDGRDQFTFLMEMGRRYRVLRNGRFLGPRFGGTLGRLPGGTQVVVSLVDRQFLVAVGGRTLAKVPLDGDNGLPRGTARPLAIGVRSLGVELDGLRVFRDVYYAWPIRPGTVGGPIRLGPDEYFVLGDNAPASEDSRVWGGGTGVPGKFLVGRPFLVHVPGRRVGLGAGRWQVPDFTQIRYIR